MFQKSDFLMRGILKNVDMKIKAETFVLLRAESTSSTFRLSRHRAKKKKKKKKRLLPYFLKTYFPLRLICEDCRRMNKKRVEALQLP